MNFIAACKMYFRSHPDQSLLQFAEEVKKLNEDDRREIAEGLEQNGFTIDELHTA